MVDYAEGWNTGHAVATALTYSENENRTPQVVVLLKIDENDREPNSGKTITAYLYLTEASGPYSMEALRAMGWQGNDLSELADASRDTAKLLPNAVRFPINLEEYNGKMRARVGVISESKASIAVKNKLQGAEAKSFAMRFRALAESVPAAGTVERKPKAAPNTQRARTNEPAPTEDDGWMGPDPF